MSDGGAPVFCTDNETGHVDVTWPEGRPEAVMLTSEALEGWVSDRNAMQAEITGLQQLVGVLRLGRRPNADQWRAAGMRPADAPAVIDLQARE